MRSNISCAVRPWRLKNKYNHGTHLPTSVVVFGCTPIDGLQKLLESTLRPANYKKWKIEYGTYIEKAHDPHSEVPVINVYKAWHTGDHIDRWNISISYSYKFAQL